MTDNNKKLVTVGNLGSVFDVNQQSKKINLKLDEQAFEVDSNGKLKVKSESFPKAPKSLELSGNNLKLKLNDDSEKVVDLSGLVPTVDLRVKSGSIDGTKLKLNIGDGGNEYVEVDLAAFLGIKHENTDTITFERNGKSDADKLKASVRLDATDNMIKSSSAGLKVKKPKEFYTDAFGVNGFYAFSQNDLT